jgi:hypothetical protein
VRVLINVLLGVVVVVFVAVVIFLFVTMRGGGDDKPDATASKAPIRYMATSGVEDNIVRRLEAKAGFQLAARCPKKVNHAIGTTFRCRVLRQGEHRTIAIAEVKIDGPRGEFSWTSSSKSVATPTPAG